MNFPLFDSMTPQNAQEHLNGFIDTESVAIAAMRGAAEQAGIVMDYSLDSLASVLKWIQGAVQIVRVPVPASEPEWIREYHKDGLIEFPDESKYLVLRGAYYLGECFIRANKKLHWAVGNPGNIEKNMPVVAGFRSGIAMAPMMVCENTFSAIVGSGEPPFIIDTMIQTWTDLMP
jgi:hypothetical protein